MVKLFNAYFLTILFITVINPLSSIASAQEPNTDWPIIKGTEQINLIYQVEHKHGIGNGKGELHITNEGFEYRGFSENEEKHSRIWHDNDIKRLEISKNALHIIAYEAASIPILPRKTPFSRGGKSIKTGTEHDYELHLVSGEITPELTTTLLTRFERSIATTVIPKDLAGSSKLLFEVPVFHRHRSGGESGVLQVYDHHMLYVTEFESHSRYWRYSDIRDIGRLGKYKFELATYEGQIATDGKSYIFDLKRPMSDAEYDTLWTKLYDDGHKLQPVIKQDTNNHKKGIDKMRLDKD